MQEGSLINGNLPRGIGENRRKTNHTPQPTTVGVQRSRDCTRTANKTKRREPEKQRARAMEIQQKETKGPTAMPVPASANAPCINHAD